MSEEEAQQSQNNRGAVKERAPGWTGHSKPDPQGPRERWTARLASHPRVEAERRQAHR